MSPRHRLLPPLNSPAYHVLLGYGAEGKHGANYVKTMAASVAGMSAMAVLIPALTLLGLPESPEWQMIAYFLCIGLFGLGSYGLLRTLVQPDKFAASLVEA